MRRAWYVSELIRKIWFFRRTEWIWIGSTDGTLLFGPRIGDTTTLVDCLQSFVSEGKYVNLKYARQRIADKKNKFDVIEHGRVHCTNDNCIASDNVVLRCLISKQESFDRIADGHRELDF